MLTETKVQTSFDMRERLLLIVSRVQYRLIIFL